MAHEITPGDIVQTPDGSEVVVLRVQANDPRYADVAFESEADDVTTYLVAELFRLGDAHYWDHTDGLHDDEAVPGCERCDEGMAE